MTKVMMRNASHPDFVGSAIRRFRAFPDLKDLVGLICLGIPIQQSIKSMRACGISSNKTNLPVFYPSTGSPEIQSSP